VNPGHERQARDQVSVFAVGRGQLLVDPPPFAQAFCLPALDSSREQAGSEGHDQRERRRDRSVLAKAGGEEERRGDSSRQDEDDDGHEPRARAERPRFEHWDRVSLARSRPHHNPSPEAQTPARATVNDRRNRTQSATTASEAFRLNSAKLRQASRASSAASSAPASRSREASARSSSA